MIKLIKSIITICSVIILISCNRKDETVKHPKKIKHLTEKEILDYHENYFKELRKKIDRIEISLYKINERVSEDTTKLIKEYIIVNKTKIKEFDLLFQSTKNHGYHCCPKTHYKLDLYNQKSKLKRYNVDTTEVKEKVLIFDSSYQTTYLISKNDWNNFINKN